MDFQLELQIHRPSFLVSLLTHKENCWPDFEKDNVFPDEKRQMQEDSPLAPLFSFLSDLRQPHCDHEVTVTQMKSQPE